MLDEMSVLHSSGTWKLVPLAPGKSTVGCHLVYIVKVGLDGQIDRLKARLVAKGLTQIFGLTMISSLPRLRLLQFISFY